jgi:hypothetical protein
MKVENYGLIVKTANMDKKQGNKTISKKNLQKLMAYIATKK